jgi:hypothetical protein
MKSLKYAVIAAVLALLPPYAIADMYKCTNNGIVAYQARPCVDQSSQTIIAEKKPSKSKIDDEDTNNNFDSILREHDDKLETKQSVIAEKLQLIDQKYAIELQQAGSDTDRIKDIENQKRLAKLPVYQELADFYEKEKKDLGDIYEAESQAAKDSRKALADLERSHKKRLREIEMMGSY